MSDVRCEHCGRLLARRTGDILHIKTSRGEEVLILRGLVHFKCPNSFYTSKGKVHCGKTTKVEVGEWIPEHLPRV